MDADLAVEAPGVRRAIASLSALVFGLVVVSVYLLPGRPGGHGPSPLATLNAVLNASAALCLCLGYTFIRLKQVRLHRAAMLAAFGLSTLFLVSYVIHHAQVGSVPFQGHGVVRSIYFAILVPHILLAAPVVPLALLTLYRGWTANYQRHRKIARVTLPLWLFVSISGVIVYWMLYLL